MFEINQYFLFEVRDCDDGGQYEILGRVETTLH